MIKYIVFGLLLIIGCLCGTTYYYHSKTEKLSQENYELNEHNIQMEISLHLEKQRTQIMNQMYKNIQSQKEELDKEIEILQTKQVVIKDCRVRIHDVNRSKGIPKILLSIGE